MNWVMTLLGWLKTAVSYVLTFGKSYGVSIAAVVTIIESTSMTDTNKAKAIASVVFAEIAKQVASILADKTLTTEQKVEEVNKILPPTLPKSDNIAPSA